MPDTHINRIFKDNREIILLGTAHVSKKSADEVKELIENEKPDTVCIELCESRYKTITDADKWKNTDIFSIIKQKKAVMMLINLVLSSYQKRLARQFGIEPGVEMVQGINSAKETGASLCLADRNIQVTLIRVWRKVGFWGKLKLAFQLLFSFLLSDDISEEEMEKMKSQDMLTSILEDLSKSFPQFKTALVDERDQYLSQKIKESPGNKVIAVLGAAHVPGVLRELENDKDHDLKQLSQVPPGSRLTKVLAWTIPVLIIVLIASTFSVDKTAGVDQIISWIIWNGTLSALGTLLALGHPISVLVAFIASPISSLNPFLAAGWFAGLMEAYIRKPNVGDFEKLSDDIHTFRGFWHNKVTHILLVVALANVGSSIGALVGGADVIRHFLNTFW